MIAKRSQMAWAVGGLFASLALAAFAFARSRVPGGFYDAEVYGMTRDSHLKYAGIGLAFAALFALAWVLRIHIEIAALTAFILVAIFYITSFLRGAHEDDG